MYSLTHFDWSIRHRNVGIGREKQHYSGAQLELSQQVPFLDHPTTTRHRININRRHIQGAHRNHRNAIGLGQYQCTAIQAQRVWRNVGDEGWGNR